MVTAPESDTAGTPDVSYARAVGERLRQVRQRRRLSLQAVERLSGQEFKASVLGAYERGDRVISVPRLQRLAVLYDVAVDGLLPFPAGSTAPGRPGHAAAEHLPGARQGIDSTEELDARLAAIAAHNPELVERYLRTIRSRRKSSEGAAIAIRADDVASMELLLGAPPPGAV